MAEKSISIIITVLNDKRINNLVDTLEAYYSDLNIEILIADGGSKDGTWEMALNLSKKYPNVVPLNAKGNVAKSRNIAIKSAKGEFISFIDADEFPSQKWLHCLLEGISKDDKIGFVAGPTPILPDKKYTLTALYYSSYLDWFYDTKAAQSPEKLPMGNSLWRKKVFDSVGYLDETISSGEDHDFANRAILNGWKGVYIKEAIVYHDYSDVTLKRLWKKQSRYAMEGVVIYSRYSSSYESTYYNILPYVIAPILLLLSAPMAFYALGIIFLILGVVIYAGIFCYLEIKAFKLRKKYPYLIYAWVEIIRRYAVIYGVAKYYLFHKVKKPNNLK